MGLRVAITGLGAVTPVGCEKDQLWESLCNGKSGIANITAFDTADHDVLIAGEAAGFEPSRWFDKKEERRLDRFSQFAVASAALALEDSGIDLDTMNREKVGAIIGTGIGGIIEIEAQHKVLIERGPSRVSPFMITKLMANAAPGYIAIKFGLQAANFSVITACASGAHAIVEAFRIVQRGEADVMFAGGTEATITPLCVSAFNNMKALSTRNGEPQKASRPFDRDRNGFVISEGSGMVILEEMESAKKRGATIYAEMLGSKMDEHNTNVYLINTGWSGGAYGVGERIDLPLTRRMVNAALNGELDSVEFETDDVFHLQVPTKCEGIPSEMLKPINTWEDKDAFKETAIKLAARFSAHYDKAYGDKNLSDSIRSQCPGK